MAENAVMSFSAEYYPVAFDISDNFQAYVAGLIVSAIVTGTAVLVISGALLIFHILETTRNNQNNPNKRNKKKSI
jgi:hypothetical protein